MLTFVYHLTLSLFLHFLHLYICFGAKIQTTYTMIFHFMLINALVYDVDIGKFSNLHFFVWMFSALLILWSSYLLAVKVLSRRLEVKCHCISTILIWHASGFLTAITTTRMTITKHSERILYIYDLIIFKSIFLEYCITLK